MGFNIALTGFDVQSFSIASVLRGNLPVTPVNISHVPGQGRHAGHDLGRRLPAQRGRPGLPPPAVT
jgi:hypothetical protein